MAQAAPIIIAVIGAAMSVYQGVQQSKQADEARDIAEQNAKREQAEAEEMARRKKKEATREESLTRARAEASGVGGKSVEDYLATQHKTNAEEIAWIKKAGASQAAITRSEGKLAQQRGKTEAMASYGKAASYAAEGGSAGYKWYTS